MRKTKRLLDVAHEFARRYVEFHDGENWEDIKLWGLFSWGFVSKLIHENVVLTDYRKEHKIIWCRPSPEFYQLFVLPAIDKYRNDTRPDKNVQWFEGNY